ncbi:hypothetical protein [Nitrosospira multiformis]|uniref:hypothetical protein n=1 Tax=Nitrosospira multiformis TaxID=1231 RepID=UPI0015E24808|nr:hypothetical protein [Nitrosospira multiformis]
MQEFSGLLQLLRKYLGRCPTPRVRHGAGVQGDLRSNPPCTPGLSVCRFRQPQGHALSGGLAPALTLP